MVKIFHITLKNTEKCSNNSIHLPYKTSTQGTLKNNKIKYITDGSRTLKNIDKLGVICLPLHFYKTKIIPLAPPVLRPLTKMPIVC